MKQAKPNPFVFAAAVGAAVSLLLAGGSQVAAETAQQNSTWQERYRWQMEEYTALQKEFTDAYERNLQTAAIPDDEDERYLWQMQEYGMLREEFGDTYAKNVHPNEVPATQDERYLWQLEEYGRLREEFHDAYNKNLQKRPFTP